MNAVDAVIPGPGTLAHQIEINVRFFYATAELFLVLGVYALVMWPRKGKR